jgi:outer membrane receptor protein involved in Fe transport
VLRPSRRHSYSLAWLAVLLALLLPLGMGGPTASAQGKKKQTQKVKADPDDDGDDDDEPDRELLIRNIVQSATKSVTTVGEAPTVINIVTAKEIDDYGYRNILTTMLTIPGYLETASQNAQMPMWTVRGITQAVLFMKDGLSLFDPAFNIVMPSLRIALENIKRIEVTSSPGGVLWGANSFLGIVNVITKDAEDINGLEVAFGGGHGPGDQAVFRPYLLFGKVFGGGKFKVFAHLSGEMFQGPTYRANSMQIYSPPPRINGPIFLDGEAVDSQSPFGWFIQFDGKATYAKPGTARALVLGWQWTWLKNTHPMGFMHMVVRDDSALSAIRRNAINFSNNFVYLKFKDRFAKNKVGINTRALYTQFQRGFDPATIFKMSPTVLDGLAFRQTTVAHRVGATFDLDVQAHRTFKILGGGEVFHEWIKDADVEFTAPLDASGQFRFDKLSVICPFYNRNGSNLPTFALNDPNGTNYVPHCKQPFLFDSNRLVVAGYISAQWRPIGRLTFDAGARIQAAPMGNAGYGVVPQYSGAAVLKLFDQTYLKANYSTGFRAPVFANFSGNPAAVEYAGNPDIKPSHSQAITTEIISKLLRNKGIIREWNLRLDYSYTLIQDRIVILSGTYENAEGTSAIHSVEFQSRLDLKGGHAFNFAYTYLYSFGNSEINGGVFRSIPNHWFSMAGIFNLVKTSKWRFDINSTVRVLGAFEDPNRVPDGTGTQISAPSAQLAFDRAPPQVHWGLGARLRVKVAKRPLEFKAQFYNVLNGDFTAVDTGFALGPRTELLPVPYQRFYFFVQAKYRL